jgi:ABC-type dipeptide/oligopeptide/nickel transport system permease subunit
MSAVRRFCRNPIAVAGAVVVLTVTVLAVAGPELAGRGYAEQDLGRTYRAAFDGAGVFGTDALGRDLWSRLLFSLRLSLGTALFSQAVQVLIGVPIGLTAGYFGGRVDRFVMRTVDTMLAFPVLLLALVIAVNIKVNADQGSGPVAGALRGLQQLTAGLGPVLVVIVVFFWLYTARVVRGAVLQVMQHDYIRAARAAGMTDVAIMRRHVLPNVWPTVIVATTLSVPAAVLTEAALSFFGVGVDPPTPSLGTLIFEGAETINAFPHLVVVPATCLALVTAAFTFVGDGMRDALDVRMQAS